MNQIQFNLKKGDEVKIDATSVHSVGVEHNISGGKFENIATETLVQTGNKVNISDGGKMVNHVVSGTLIQKDNEIELSGDSRMENKVGNIIDQSLKTVAKVADAAKSIFGK